MRLVIHSPVGCDHAWLELAVNNRYASYRCDKCQCVEIREGDGLYARALRAKAPRPECPDSAQAVLERLYADLGHDRGREAREP